jgi:hypothetical protein
VFLVCSYPSQHGNGGQAVGLGSRARSDFKGLQVMRDDIAKYLRRDQPKHAIAFERPARIIVRFEDEQDARRFYFTFDGRFIRL